MHRVLFCILAILPFLFAASHASPAESDAPAPQTAFPLRVSDDHRHLVGADGKPFLIVGDTAWSLIAQLDTGDIARYLDDRQKRGYNAIIVNLIEARFATNAPKTKAGVAPFTQPRDFATPNPAYFDWAHQCIAAANQRGIAVFLCPAYLGWDGGDEGFFSHIVESGSEKLRGYGRFIAKRFADLPNIVWMPGGDYSMPERDRWTVNELAAGIGEIDRTHLMTGHAGQKSPRDAFGEPDWLQIDNTYSYAPDLWRQLRRDATREPRMPVFLSETIYEGEHSSTPEQIRRQAWWAMLSGHCGQFFGNNPMWHFDGPGLFDTDVRWQAALDSEGSRDIARLGALLREFPWQTLRPDFDGKIVIEPGDGTERIAAAVTKDQSLTLIYIPSTGGKPRGLKLAKEFAAHAGSGSTEATWWNPTDGTRRDAGAPPFQTPGDNGTGTNDWLLILEKENGTR
ncbi:MAG: DUF4038 domain-containing protein [Chthoniobacteraceae bacterium]